MDLKKLRQRTQMRHVAGTDVPRQDRTSKFLKHELKRAGKTGYAGISGEVEGTSARPRLDRPARRAGGPVVGRQQDHEERIVTTKEDEAGYRGKDKGYDSKGTPDPFEHRPIERHGEHWKHGGKVRHRYAGGKVGGPMLKPWISRDGADGLQKPHTWDDFEDRETMHKVRKDGGMVDGEKEEKKERPKRESGSVDLRAGSGASNPDGRAPTAIPDVTRPREADGGAAPGNASHVMRMQNLPGPAEEASGGEVHVHHHIHHHLHDHGMEQGGEVTGGELAGAGAPHLPHGLQGRAHGGKVEEKWIQKAVPESHKGRLHKALGVPEGKKIPEKKLEKAEHSGNAQMRHMAQFAENVKK